MLSEQGSQNLFAQINTNWVIPEIEKRRATGTLSDDFKIRRCLVRLPIDADPVVEFDDEISWIAKVKIPKGVAVEKDAPVYLSQMEFIDSVEPPEIDGKRVAFFYVHWNGVVWRIFFDTSPNLSPDVHRPSETGRWDLGRQIGDAINGVLREQAVRYHDRFADDIQQIGLWAAPSLLPYPLSRIAEFCEQGTPEDGRHLLVEHCNVEFLQGIIQEWSAVEAFSVRKLPFGQAMDAHRNRQYALSIPALLPHIEGVMTDWLYTKLPPLDRPFRQVSKTKKFRDILMIGAQRAFTDRRTAESVLDFILDGPVLAPSTDWLTREPNSFASRNAVAHGKYDPSVYTEENSLKVFLLLDTLYQIIANYADSDFPS